MPRLKKSTLYNKNHIVIIKEEYPRSDYELRVRNAGYYSHTVGGNFERIPNPDKGKTIKKESPLGFYYNYKISEHDTISIPSLMTQEYYLYLGNIKYIINYPRAYGNTSLSEDIRPWIILPGDKTPEDHFIQDLLKVLNNIFQQYKDSKEDVLQFIPQKREDNTGPNKETSNIMSEMFKDIFGNPKGPRFQTNDEKIIAAGFDLKTSFRKM